MADGRGAHSIDWPAVLEDLRLLLGEPAAGNPNVREACSSQALANALGIPRGTLRNWLDGSEPRHSDGEQLLDRWCQLSGKARIWAPRERRPLTGAERARLGLASPAR